MKSEKEIKIKITEHDLHIEHIKSLLLSEENELAIFCDVVRLEYGRKALLWVLSDKEFVIEEITQSV